MCTEEEINPLFELDSVFDEYEEERMEILEEQLYRRSKEPLPDDDKETHSQAYLFGYALAKGISIRKAETEIRERNKQNEI